MAPSSRLVRKSPKQQYWDHYYGKFGAPPAKKCQYNLLYIVAFLLLTVYFAFSGFAYYALQSFQEHQQQEQSSPLLFEHHNVSATIRKQHKPQQQQSSQTTARNAVDESKRPDHPQPKLVSPDTNEMEAEASIRDRTDRIFSSGSLSSLILDQTSIQSFLGKHGASKWSQTIIAYVEPPMKDLVPNTGSRGDMKTPKDHGVPPDVISPLPLRTHGPDALQKVEYNRVKSCLDMPHKLPIDEGLQLDKDGNPIVTNVGDSILRSSWKEESLPYCPVNTDPFLPWIHDIFPAIDGSVVHVIAQNKRRCHSGSKDTDYVNYMAPQAALMQPISVERIDETTAQQLAPSLWKTQNTNNATQHNSQARYRLAAREQIRNGHNYTRFICRFTTIDPSNGEKVVLGETLSEYEFNYELASYRKKEKSLLTPKGKDTKLFWTSNIRFACPVPESPLNISGRLASGELIHWDETSQLLLPLVYLDVVPIRTSVRYMEHYLGEELIGPPSSWKLPGLVPKTAWGDTNVLPHFEASGRWENLPICSPPKLITTDEPQGRLAPELLHPSLRNPGNGAGTRAAPQGITQPKKPHYLSACLWASAEFKTRGLKRGATTDTSVRLVEWIEFHLLVGFDHFYVYDNSGAHTNSTSLRPTLEPYIAAGFVTYVEWPFLICNNNIPAADDTGERSTQYAAENSCRTRSAPFTEWIASFDTDEFLVPMGENTNLKSMLKEAHETTKVNIMSFRSSRGRLRLDMSIPHGAGRVMSPNATYLQAYNCDSAGSPKPEWAERARKQVYRADYCLYHYVHYATVTQGYLDTYADHVREGRSYNYGFREHPPSERPSKEMTEAVMVHTKTVKQDQTLAYQSHCHYNWTKKWQGCWVGYAWPKGVEDKKSNHNEDGMEYNCFINDNVETHWIPKLLEALAKRKKALRKVDN